jgi:hypothetical protein
MNSKTRPLSALVVIAMGAVISACGSSGPAQTGTRRSDDSSTLAKAQKAMKFAACMRHNGASHFPDPGASGQLTIDEIANGSGVNISAPAFTHALSACKSLEPAGFTGARRSASQQRAALGFAQCIRDHGVKDFPDPVNGQPLVDTNRIPSTGQPGGLSILNAAMQQCRGAAAAAGIHR